MQQTLIPYFRPAFQRTVSILTLVADFVDDYKFLTNWNSVSFEGWKLPATLDPHYWCGLWNTEGCLNTKEHERLGKGKRVYIKQYQRSCYRASCKTCYLRWIARQANNATRRIEQYTKNHGGKPIHLILSIPPSQHHLPVKLLRERMSQILKIAEFEGGAVIFHPFRLNKKTSQWYTWPHFHLLGFGSHQKIVQAFGKYGWYIKEAGERESVFQTFCYILSHCGVRKGCHILTWFGDLSYSKLPVEKEPKITCCPVCGAKFVKVYYDGIHPVAPPDKHFEGLVDSDDKWYEVENIWEKEWTKRDRYEYALT